MVQILPCSPRAASRSASSSAGHRLPCCAHRSSRCHAVLHRGEQAAQDRTDPLPPLNRLFPLRASIYVAPASINAVALNGNKKSEEYL